MTVAPELPLFAGACDCSGLLGACGHCACDRCEDCGECSGGAGCTCACMTAERGAAARRAELYLGTHMTSWLWDARLRGLFGGVTFFVSRVRLAQRKSPFPSALHPYCIDSGGFTELQRHGRWTLTPAEYVAEIRRYLAQLGPGLCRWVAPQDWMCEEIVIRGGAGARGTVFHGTRRARGLPPGGPEQDLTMAVRIHQRLTVENYLTLTALAPEIPFIAVLQGSTLADYRACDAMYAAAGVDLSRLPVVGLGSVCRRQATSEIEEIVEHFAGKGYRLHGFGVKTLGLARYADGLVSADSMAWSEDARRSDPLPGHETRHINCANCPDWAARWHQRIVTQHLAPADLEEAA